ncbi:MAG: hypothetical protein AVDCRST_MAG11-4185, partial [uncultured Gemmatimonadaceae bacterium]
MPLPAPPTPLDRPGVEYVRAVLSGEEPHDPLLVMLGVRLTEVPEPGRVALEARPRPEHLNFGGIVHGGYLSAVMDGAVGFALHSTLGPNRVCPHVQADYRFLRAALAGQVLRLDAWALRSGRHLGHARVEVRDPAGVLLCSGESTH